MTGSHRSGTTWVGQMIAKSPNVYYIDEPFNIAHDPGVFKLKIDKWFYYVPREANEPYYSAIFDMLCSKQYDLLRGLSSVRSFGEIRRVLKHASDSWQASLRHSRSLLKDPIAIFSAEWLAAKFPLDVIVMIRHPAAFVSSLKRFNWHHEFDHFLNQPRLMTDWLYPFEADLRSSPQDIVDQGVLLWRIIYSAVDKYRRLHPDWMFVRHEDLSGDPIGGFRNIFNHLQIKWTPEVAGIIASFSRSDNPVQSTNPMLIERNSAAAAKAWKNLLSKEEIDRVRRGTEDIWPIFYSLDEWA